MNKKTERARHRPRLASMVAVGVAALALALATGCGDEDDAPVTPVDHSAAAEHPEGPSPQIHTDAGHAFQDEMRKLWEDHVTWTRLAIVSFVDDLPDLKPTVARLMQNQEDIGDAIKPYYGERTGDRLTELLKGHIDGAVELLSAAKAADDKGVKKASAAWYRNGNQVADFLSAANHENWRKGDMRSMMKGHLDQTVEEATHRLKGNHKAEIRSYDQIHRHILVMADALSDGIEAQFPERFE